MIEWRERILRELPAGVSPLTIVSDPDSLLREQDMLETLQNRGFVCLEHDDPIRFRFAWESKCRARWDRGEPLDALILMGAGQPLHEAPADLLADGRTVRLSLSTLFPQLDYSVVKELDTSHYDALFDALQSFSPGTLGGNATKEFILRHVFEIAPELIKTPVDLLRIVLRRHYTKQNIPAVLQDRLVSVLEGRPRLADWPLRSLMGERGVFLRFLQERWDAHVLAHERRQVEVTFTVPGPSTLPFEHDDVRVYLDNYFTEGLLRRVKVNHSQWSVDSWESIGITIDVPSVIAKQAQQLLSRLEQDVPGDRARPTDWFRYSYELAELDVMLFDHPELAETITPAAVLHRVSEGFTRWLLDHYAGLANLPATPPVMVHHVPRYLSRLLQHGATKVAVVVVDGLSLSQWVAIRDGIQQSNRDAICEEDAVFAWLPTLTSVSRQAIFSGLPPLYFPDSLDTTSREAKAWQRFWSQHHVDTKQVGYLKGLGTDDLSAVRELASAGHIRVLGLVVDTVDRIMHGMELGASGMLSQVRQWAGEGYMASLLKCLLDNNYVTIIMSDHGNCEALGRGRINEGVVSEMRGQRVRVCGSKDMRNRLIAEYGNLNGDLHAGLPDDFWPVYPLGKAAFVGAGERIVAHGGNSLEEAIVPLVTVQSAGAAL